MTAQGKAALLELRDRLAKATGPDRELDIAIAEFLGWRVMQERGEPRYWIDPATPSGAGILDPEYHLAFPPRLTASLDSAVTLVPRRTLGKDGPMSLHINQDDDGSWSVEFRDGYCTSYGATYVGEAETLPLALCLARLEYELVKEGQP